MSVAQQKGRNPLALGWEAARANAIPALLLQALMLAILIGYYVSPTVARALEALAEQRRHYGMLFVIGAGIIAGAIVPELFLIIFFQGGKPRRKNLRNLVFTVPSWGFDAVLVDWMYRLNTYWFGDVVTPAVLLAKICVDQFGYNPFFAAPAEVLVYEWKNEGVSWSSVRRSLTWANYRERIVPTLLATWAVWMPLMAIIYSLPLALQFPLFSVALTFWVLLLTYMTSRFSERVAADRPLALATSD
ncbi:MAG: hypothetical protein M3032_01975 [Verrucomicrobiota bacterium]|nr:hypothetical protein [Verrucomicrobiota bacterium]